MIVHRFCKRTWIHPYLLSTDEAVVPVPIVLNFGVMDELLHDSGPAISADLLRTEYLVRYQAYA